VQWVDLPLGVSKYPRMLGHFLLIDIKAHLFTADVSPKPWAPSSDSDPPERFDTG
jgi:hypothetical protein